MKKRMLALACLLVLLPQLIAWRSLSPSDPGAASNMTAESCRALADLRIEDTNLLSAAVVPASDDLPEYCRVLGYVRPAINFEIRLPTSGWNGKFYMAGCGGFCGKLNSDSEYVLDIARPLRRGYAVSMTDGGHWGEHLVDGRWAYHNRQAEIDFGYRAVHETARVTKTVVQAFFGSPPAHSYFGGCSNAGRQGVMQALRYPDDFDGIIAHDPVLDFPRGMMHAAWIARANTGPDGSNLITARELQLLRVAVYRACDGLDGLEDGLISDPRACRFDPATLACGREGSGDCMSAEQVRVLRLLYHGPRDSLGQQLFPGLPFGSEPYWGLWITGPTPAVDDDPIRALAENYFRYMAFEEDPGESYAIEEFDWDRDPPRLEFMGGIYNATSPELDAFRQRGGKLLMLQTWADLTGASPFETIGYYETVEGRFGPAQTRDLFRLFMVPGADHCGFQDGPGIRDSGFDPLAALERWVEHGEAPQNLLTTKTDAEGNVVWTRPICPYPQSEVYDGRGDVREASSFTCRSR